MKNIILFFTTICLAANCYAQKNEAVEFYNLGVKAYNDKNFKLADSLFTLSGNLEPNVDTYYNLALTKNILGDKCGFCRNIGEASGLGDSNAKAKYNKYCYKSDTVRYANYQDKNFECYCVISKTSCQIGKTIKFHKVNKKTKITTYYLFEPKDSVEAKNNYFNSPQFDIGKFYQDSVIYSIEMPSYPGGDEARLKFLQENIHYPQMAKENNIQGTVYITFIVDEKGEVKDVRILRGIGEGCDEEAVRVVRLIPKWNPGKLNGKNVRVQFNIPIRFSLSQ